MTKFTLNNPVLRLARFTATTVLLKTTLKVSIYIFILFSVHTHNPHAKHALTVSFSFQKQRGDRDYDLS